MYSQVRYMCKLQATPQKNMRKNVNAYYFVLKSSKGPQKEFSKPLLIDQDPEGFISSTNDLEFDLLQLWNYDKMRLVQEYKVPFTVSDTFNFACHSEQVILSIQKIVFSKFTRNRNSGKLYQRQNINVYGRKSSENESQLSKTAREAYKDNYVTESEDSTVSKRCGNNYGVRIVSKKEYHAY